jgi:hypothetical protein
MDIAEKMPSTKQKGIYNCAEKKKEDGLPDTISGKQGRRDARTTFSSGDRGHTETGKCKHAL